MGGSVRFGSGHGCGGNGGNVGRHSECESCASNVIWAGNGNKGLWRKNENEDESSHLEGRG